MTQISSNNRRSISSSVSYDRLREIKTQNKQNSCNPSFTIHCKSNTTWNKNEPSAPLPEGQCLREKSLQNSTSGVLSSEYCSLGQEPRGNITLSALLQEEFSLSDNSNDCNTSSRRALGNSNCNPLASETNLPKVIS